MRQSQHGLPRKTVEDPTGSGKQNRNHKQTQGHQKSEARALAEHGSCGTNAQCIRQTQHRATKKGHWLIAIAIEKKQKTATQVAARERAVARRRRAGGRGENILSRGKRKRVTDRTSRVRTRRSERSGQAAGLVQREAEADRELRSELTDTGE